MACMYLLLPHGKEACIATERSLQFSLSPCPLLSPFCPLLSWKQETQEALLMAEGHRHLTHVSGDRETLSIFSCVCCPPVCLLWKSVQVLCPFSSRLFVFLMLSHKSSLYVLDINSLSDISFANILSHSEGCLFVLSIVCCTKASSFEGVHVVCLYFPCQRRHIQRNITKPDAKGLAVYDFFWKFSGFRSYS